MLRTPLILRASLVLLIISTAVATAEPVVTLTEGDNEVSLVFSREGTVPGDQLRVEVITADLPHGVQVGTPRYQGSTVDPADNEARAVFPITVAAGEAPTSFILPFRLQATDGRVWQFQATAQVTQPLPVSTRLLPSAPNPFNPSTCVRYALAGTQPVRARLEVFSISGQRVRTLVDGDQTAGSYAVVWDGQDEQGREVAAGRYLCRLIAGDVVRTQGMVLVK